MFSGVAWLAIYIAISTSLVGTKVAVKVKTTVIVLIITFCIFDRSLKNVPSVATPTTAKI